MTSFDPATVRQAVAEFTPLRPQKFQDLLPAKDVIAELRQRRASYRAIAELLTQHCLPTSKTAIATVRASKGVRARSRNFLDIGALFTSRKQSSSFAWRNNTLFGGGP
jgi:hypothetical protein